MLLRIIMNKTTKIILSIGGVFLFTPFIIYIYNFHGHEISKNTETWGQFGDYLNGTFMPLIALAGVAITLLLGIISDRRNQANIEIERLKQRPLLHIGYWDYQNKIEIFMKNKGIGPLLIKSYKIFNVESKTFFDGLYDCLPILEKDYDNYTGNKNNIVLSPGEEDQLLLYENEKNKKNDIQKLRHVLKDLKIIVEYKDVYDNEMPIYERSLEWFGRHFKKDN